MKLNDSVFVVIRSIGERTEALCKHYIELQGISSSNLVIINRTPFHEALAQSFREGIKASLKYTLMVDADVLLRKDSIINSINEFEKQDAKCFELQGRVLDKFFGGPREAGFHLYKTRYLEKLLKESIKFQNSLRPEGEIIKHLSKQGLTFVRANILLGLHDFEQSNVDIYRKAFVQARKHLYRGELFISNCKEKMNNDNDFNIALRGFVDGILTNEDIEIDKNNSLISKMYMEYSFKEKNPIQSYSEFDFFYLESIINNWNDATLFKQYLGLETKDFLKGGIFNDLSSQKVLTNSKPKMRILHKMGNAIALFGNFLKRI
ncbi:hypothetical protein ACFCT7_15525 [Fulvivirgaceae bacterium LMO-SS25]